MHPIIHSPVLAENRAQQGPNSEHGGFELGLSQLDLVTGCVLPYGCRRPLALSLKRYC